MKLSNKNKPVMNKKKKALIAEKRLSFRKKAALIAMMLMLFTAIIAMSVISGSADTYFTVRINYYYVDGSPAHDPYIATYRSGDDVSITVNNPNIDGYVPMTAESGGFSAATTTLTYDDLSENHSVDVYYVAGLTYYRARYYKQNIYDDLYTPDNTLDAEYTDRYGYTGENPDGLEDVEFEGFTNLFHEPDAIAADGSTVFRVYYDRNYYTVLFDLGEGGYGVEPVYAKYQTVYHIAEPKRVGYTFLGWLRTDKDSSAGTYAHSERRQYKGSRSDDRSEDTWRFVDDNGDELVDANGDPLFDANGIPVDPDSGAESYYLHFTQNTIPAENSYYKAVWSSGTTHYSVVYWIEKPDSVSITEEDINQTADIAEARALIAANYNVVVARDIENVESGTLINLDTIIQNAGGQDMQLHDLFAYDLTNTEVFPMSDATRAELVGKQKYYSYNRYLSSLQFTGPHEEYDKTDIEVMGDGSTRINVYYDRAEFTLKFYYAQEQLSNGQPNGKIQLTNSTKEFSKYNYYGKNEDPIVAVSKGTWAWNVAETLPTLNTKYTDPDSPDYIPGLETKYTDYNGYRYYYYEVKANYNAPLYGKWLIDAITPVHKRGFADDEICYPGSWATEYNTEYQYHNTTAQGGKNNFTVKGVYDRLGDELMFRNRTQDYTELHFLLSWTNSATTNNGWNYGVSKVLHFTYESYFELLPREIDMAENSPDGYQVLIDNGTYIDVIERTYTDTEGNTVTKAFGLTAGQRLETTDSGDQYPYKSDPAKRSDNNSSVYGNQTATEIKGFTLVNYATDATGKAVLNANNTEIDWSEDSSTYRKATIKFFYNRNSYKLKWRNGNRLESAQERDVLYGAPLNSTYLDDEDGHTSGEYRYWFSDPAYFNEDLTDYYRFEGWYYTPYYYRLADRDSMTMPADDLTLYAKWTPKVINVSFYNNYNDYYLRENRIGEAISVDYGSYTPLYLIPANYTEEEEEEEEEPTRGVSAGATVVSAAVSRPHLTPPAEGATFAGFYYIDNRVPRRFEPENIPVTALNKEAAENGEFRLYAEWVTKDVAKYKVNYVEANDPDTKVADSTEGRAFVTKTKTFTAKSGDELDEAHRWTAEGADTGNNWWPTTNSHSILIKKNSVDPNEYTFYYIQKAKVHYKVQYLDAASRTPLRTEYVDETNYASIEQDAPFIPGYIAQTASQTLTLTASTAADPADQEAEELEANVITFLYDKNTTDYLYQVEYFLQDLEGDSYSLYRTENLTVPIAEEGDTTVSLASLYARHLPEIIASNGFSRVAGGTEVTTVNSLGASATVSAADDADIVITGDAKTTVKIYFDRDAYTYSYRYIDYTAERNYRAYISERSGVSAKIWDGVIEDHPDAGSGVVESTVGIPAPMHITYNGIPYTRISDKEVTVTIEPITESNPTVNLARVYYRKDAERELQYKMVCVNDNPDTDYADPATRKEPLFGGLSATMQNVEDYDEVNDIVFYNFNDATRMEGGREVNLHLHKYKFLGWYASPSYDPDHPETGRLTTSETLTKSDMPGGELPASDTTYYALVEQVMVTCDIDLVYLETDITEESDDSEALRLIKEEAVQDNEGAVIGQYADFTNPVGYVNHTLTPWHRTDGYSMSMTPIDNRIYKYEFAEWWEIVKRPVAEGEVLPEGTQTEVGEDGQTYKIVYIRKTNWNNDGQWDASDLENQVTRNGDKHFIAVYRRKAPKTALNVELHYLFKSRGAAPGDDPKDFVIKQELTDDALTAALVDDNNAYALTNAYIMQNAPYESNYGETLCWTDANITKDSDTGTDTVSAVVTAQQTVRTVYAHYRTAPDGEFTTIRTFYGANYKLDEAMESITAPDTYNGRSFSYWAVRKSSDDSTAVAAKSYDTLFDLCMMDNYYISPVYEIASQGYGDKSAVLDPSGCQNNDEQWLAWTWSDDSAGVWVRPDANMRFSGLSDKVIFVRANKTISLDDFTWSSVWNQTDNLSMTGFEGEDYNGCTFTLSGYSGDQMVGSWNTVPTAAPANAAAESAPTAVLTHLDYTRNRWTDENGTIVSSGETDLLYTDFEISFEDNGVLIQNSSDYQTGVVFELCAKVPADKDFDPSRDYRVVSDMDALKAAVLDHLNGETVTQYNYKPGKARSLQFSDIPTSDLTNKNRVEFAKLYYNAFNPVDGEPAYTNSTYLLKATAYIVKDGNVTLSNSVYTCLKGVASQNNALPSMINPPAGE